MSTSALAAVDGDDMNRNARAPKKTTRLSKQLSPVRKKVAFKNARAQKPNASKHKLMLVDDDHRIRESFFRALTLYGYNVIVAANGRDALALFQKKKPKIVLLDIRMPDIDGFTVLKTIREQSAATQVIFITGHGDMGLVIDALRAGASDFMPKPIQIEALLEVLKNAEQRLERLKKSGALTPRLSVKEPLFAGASAPIQIRAFGSLIVRSGNETLQEGDWQSQKIEMVFKAFLCNHRKVVSQTFIIDTFWDDVKSKSAEVGMFTAVSVIRRLLEPDLTSGRDSRFLLSRSGGYELNLGRHGENYDYDVDHFRRWIQEAKIVGEKKLYEKAVALYNDELLKNCDAEWARSEREQLRDDYLRALVELARWHFAEKNYDACEQYAEKVLQIDGLFETGYELAIKSALAQGKPGKAARTLERCDMAFQEELGVAAPQRLRALVAR